MLGSVASGAELVAGGSIHVYGTLRGRAMAGSHSNSSARIFCSKIEAELVAIDGYYLTAESLDQKFPKGPVQAWLDGDAVKIAVLRAYEGRPPVGVKIAAKGVSVLGPQDPLVDGQRALE